MVRGGRFLLAFVVAGAGAPWGCRREGVRSYSIPKEAERGAAGGVGAMGGALAKGTVPPMGASGVGARAGAFVAPANWKAEADGSGILAAAFTAENAQGGARITLASLFNDGGGLLANINRWRGQLDLAPVGTLAEQPTTDLGGGAVMVDLRDAAGARRMVMAVVTEKAGGAQGEGVRTWFFKVTGSVEGAEAERAAFERFVRTVGLGEP